MREFAACWWWGLRRGKIEALALAAASASLAVSFCDLWLYHWWPQ